MTTTLGQQRAKFCLEQLEKITCKHEDFKSFSASLPAMILQNGFGQTLAFLAAKGQDKHLSGFTIITDWLVDRNLVKEGQHKNILTQVSSMTQRDYLYAQRETLAMLEWLKRYANAKLFD